MKHMKHTMAGLVIAALIGGGGLVAAQDRDEPTVGSTVTLTACVEKALNGDKYVLPYVADVPAHPPSKGGRVIYWFTQVDKFRPHVGHQIRLVGKVTDVDQDELEVKLDGDGTGRAIVEIEGPLSQVKTSPATIGVSTAGQTEKERAIPTTTVKLKIERLDMVSERCTMTR